MIFAETDDIELVPGGNDAFDDWLQAGFCGGRRMHVRLRLR
jgi:hypothetical protein